jgi:hypothetical protein
MDFEIAYTNKKITPWGGMVLLKKMLDRIGFHQAVDQCTDLPQPGSNRGYKPLSIIESFPVSIRSGANKFLHTEITRHDLALCNIFGWKQMPGNDAFKRFFRKFGQADSHRVNKYFYRRMFDNLHFDNYTLDCDSGILTRYGKQEGSRKGYNPHKPGRQSHHPIMAFVADLKLVANFRLRSGNSSAGDNCVSFLSDTLDNLQGKNISLLRPDSGFHSQSVLEFIETKAINYIIAARFYEPVQHEISRLKSRFKLDEGIDVSEMSYQSPSRDKPRRIVVVRQRIKDRPDATGKQPRLFKDDELLNPYRYSAYITNLSLSAADVCRLYRGKADAENRIRELKYDFGFDSFNPDDFFGTEAALGIAMLAYNLMALFRQFILNSKVQHTLSTLRFKAFAIGAYFEKTRDKVVLKMAIHKKRRQWFAGLWEAAKAVNLPFEFSND